MHLHCPHCRNPIELVDLAPGADVTCAGCGSTFQLEAPSTIAGVDAGSRRLGKFELLAPLGQGAFGIVYQARDTELDRIVAIKVPREGNIGSGPEDLDRFLREARAVAQLRFPSIIAIHEVGADDGRPYLVCDFIEGITLADVLTGRRLAFAEAGKLVAEVSEALHYAHSLGVVHRDVKPSNIMIRPDGSPCVMDFGLAKRDAGEITMTMDGQVLGTPAYMSPEQARGEGHQVDGRSDVYSLGVILYQCLTGELPFRGNKTMLLHQVLHDEPTSPRRLNDRISRDLETIALKAMAKEPARRYASARDLADDLRRWLAGEPIHARPVGSLERLQRWAKRNPALATANAAVCAALLTFVVAFLFVKAALDQEQIERNKATQLAAEKDKLAGVEREQRIQVEKLARSNQQLATEMKAIAGVEQTNRISAEKLAKANKQLALDAEMRREHAENLAVRIEFEHYYFMADERPDLTLVGMASLLPRAARLKDQTLTESLRRHLGGWMDHGARLKSVFAHDGRVVGVALSADGKVALTAGTDSTAQLWDTATGKPIGRPLWHPGGVTAVTLSTDGKLALTGCLDAAHLWETSTGKQIGLLKHQGEVSVVALSASGKTALTGSHDKTARLWDTATGKPIGAPLQHQAQILAVAFGSHDTKAITGSFDRTARIWDVATGNPIGAPLEHQGPVFAVALSAHAATAATGGNDSTARLWDATTGNAIAPPLRHGGAVMSVALSPSGQTLLTGSRDNIARLWDTTKGLPIGVPLQHHHAVASVALSADGKTALTGSLDKTARRWETATGRPMGPPLQHLDSVVAVKLSTDGNTILTAGDTTARLWSTIPEPTVRSFPHPPSITTVALDASGKTALTASVNGTAQLWEAGTGKPMGAPLHHEEAVLAAALSADGTIALTGSRAKTAHLWNTTTAKSIAPILKHHNSVTAVAFAANNKTVLTGSIDGTVQLWDAAAKPVGRARKHGGWVRSVALSADGTVALATDDDLTARLWETLTGNPVGSPLSHQAKVIAVALSADGRIALSGSHDYTARLWNTTTGKPIGPPLQHRDKVVAVALSADGKTAFTGSEDKSARVWETATGKPIGPPLMHPTLLTAVALSANGEIALTGCEDAKARLWKLPRPMQGDPERIILWTQVVTGLEVDELTAVRVLDAKSWHERRQRLEKLGGLPMDVR